MIVCDPFLYQSGVAEKLGGALEGKTVSYFSGTEPNPIHRERGRVQAEAARAARAETVTRGQAAQQWTWRRSRPGS